MENGTISGLFHSSVYETVTANDEFTHAVTSNTLINSCCSANCSYNLSDDCDSLLETFLRANLMSFGPYILMRVILTATLFIISAIGNLIALWSVFANRSSRRAVRGMSNTQVIMLHMTLADLAFTFFILPMDAIWNATGQWLAGNTMCKIFTFLKYFGMYSSSGMITVMALERMTCILTHPTPAQQRKRMTIFVVSAWSFAILNAIPALVLFSVPPVSPCQEKCPDHQITQCVDFGLIPSSDLRDYYIYTMMISFFLPLAVIIISHSFIILEITRMAMRDKALMGRRKSITTNHIHKARNKSLLITILITSCFLLCWGTYYVKGLYDWSRPDSKISSSDYDNIWMYLSMYLNPCLHPIIFAIFMKSVGKQFRVAWSILLCRKRPARANELIAGRNQHTIMSTTFNGHNTIATVNPEIETQKSLLQDKLSPTTNYQNENRKITFSDEQE